MVGKFTSEIDGLLREIEIEGARTDLFLRQQRAAREQSVMIRKVYDPDAQHQQSQQQAQDWRSWDDWCRAHIAKAIDDHDEPLINAINDFVSEREGVLLERIGELTARIEVLEAIVRSTNVKSIEAKRDAA